MALIPAVVDEWEEVCMYLAVTGTMVNSVRVKVRGGSGVEIEVGALTRLCSTQPSFNLLDLLLFIIPTHQLIVKLDLIFGVSKPDSIIRSHLVSLVVAIESFDS